MVRIITYSLYINELSDIMKAEEMSRKCPECNSQDKKISRRSKKGVCIDASYMAHMPQEDVGIIRCTECGYIFEYCTHRNPPLRVKILLV